jgi:hypothetical protein
MILAAFKQTRWKKHIRTVAYRWACGTMFKTRSGIQIGHPSLKGLNNFQRAMKTKIDMLYGKPLAIK